MSLRDGLPTEAAQPVAHHLVIALDLCVRWQLCRRAPPPSGQRSCLADVTDTAVEHAQRA